MREEIDLLVVDRRNLPNDLSFDASLFVRPEVFQIRGILIIKELQLQLADLLLKNVPLEPAPSAVEGTGLIVEQLLERCLLLRSLDNGLFVDLLSRFIVDIFITKHRLVRVAQISNPWHLDVHQLVVGVFLEPVSLALGIQLQK